MPKTNILEETSDRPPSSVVTTVITRVVDSFISSVDDELAVEEPLEIRIEFGPRGARRVKPLSVTMRTPGNDFELAVGFLLSEGVIRDVDDLDELHDVDAAAARHARGVLRVALRPDLIVPELTLERNFYTTSSCGVCGKASLMALRVQAPPPRKNDFRFEVAILNRLSDSLHNRQHAFSRTGGLHAAALFSSTGDLLQVREDVGRHNAVDKLLGRALLDDALPSRNTLLFLSGRASFELLQKAVMAAIPLVAALGAPSSLAVDIAREFDITLVGFLKATRFNVYHGAERLGISAQGEEV